MRTPLIPTASAICGEVRIDEIGADRQEAGRFLLELDEAERAVVEDDDFDRQLELDEAQEIAHQHGEAAVAGERDHLTAGRRPPGRRWPAASRWPSSRARTSR